MISNTANIVEFPKKKTSGYVPGSLNEILSSEMLRKNTDIQIITEDILLSAFDVMDRRAYVGFDLKLHRKELAMFAEGIKAFLYKLKDLDHPFHTMADQLFEIDESEDMVYFKKNKEA